MHAIPLFRFVAVAWLLAFCLTSGAPAAAQTRFVFSRYTTLIPSAGWTVAAADLDISPPMDVAAYHPSDGSLWACYNSGHSFQCLQKGNDGGPGGLQDYRLASTKFEQGGMNRISAIAYDNFFHRPVIRFMKWDPNLRNLEYDFLPVATAEVARRWQIYNANFFADAVIDYVLYQPELGTLARQDWGTGNPTQVVATLSPKAGWRFVQGDFDFDGKADLMGYHWATGTLRLCRNRDATFDCSQVFTATGPAGFSLVGITQMIAGRFIRGLAAPALMAYRARDGALFVGRRSGASYAFTQWATMSPAASWTWTPGYFSPNSGREGPEDIVGYQAGDGGLWVGKPQ